MGRLFLFGIGGTGARVVRSLTMLLSTGVKVNCDKIVPIIIDVDSKNEDTARTIKAMDMYKLIRDKVYASKNVPKEGFFTTDIGSLGSEGVEGVNTIKTAFKLEFGNITKTFYDYMQVARMSNETQELMRLLFDDSPEGDTKTELNLNLTVGFKGNPNLGSIIFNDLVNTEEYKYFARAFTPNDRIFIVSSIFGGTGSSGFPQLVKNLRRNSGNLNDALKTAKIGTAIVMPYFTVEDNKASAVDARNFMSKTKAALSYYHKELKGQDKLDEVFYLYDEPGNPYANNEGGTSQKNDAHLVEMLGAMAIVKFANQAQFSPNTEYYEYGIRKKDAVLNFTHFFEDLSKDVPVAKALTLMIYFAKICKDILPKYTYEKEKDFSKYLNLKANFQDTRFIYKDLGIFIFEHFIKYMEELARNAKFEPFNLDLNKEFNAMINGKPIVDTRNAIARAVGGAYALNDDGYFTEKMTEIEANLRKSNVPDEERFIKMCYEVCKIAFDEYIKVPPVASY
ncbi:MAG: hypothetical protein ACKVOM_02730 [Ferruginibacter sp.]